MNSLPTLPSISSRGKKTANNQVRFKAVKLTTREIMKENLKTILQSLRSEQTRLETEKQSLCDQIRSLGLNRKSAARRCVQTLLPDLSPDSVKTLRREVPGFRIPTVSTWWGLSKKIDPSASVDTLRMQLGAYLDDYQTGLKVVPDIWTSSVARADEIIRDLQKNQARTVETSLSDIKARIGAIEKLSNANLRKMDPKARRKLERALAAQAKSARSPARLARIVRASRVTPVYPTQSQVDSDSGPSPLEMWLWYQLLTPNSETSHEIDSFVGGGGSSGGGGADGSLRDSSNDSVPAAIATANVESVDTHIALGAGSFS